MCVISKRSISFECLWCQREMISRTIIFFPFFAMDQFVFLFITIILLLISVAPLSISVTLIIWTLSGLGSLRAHFIDMESSQLIQNHTHGIISAHSGAYTYRVEHMHVSRKNWLQCTPNKKQNKLPNGLIIQFASCSRDQGGNKTAWTNWTFHTLSASKTIFCLVTRRQEFNQHLWYRMFLQIINTPSGIHGYYFALPHLSCQYYFFYSLHLFVQSTLFKWSCKKNSQMMGKQSKHQGGHQIVRNI